MKPNILLLSIYPAPYRLKLCEYISEEFNADIFFEYKNGDDRDDRWFQKGQYHLLDTEQGMEKYRQACACIRKYALVILYDYGTKEGRKLIARCKRLKIPYIVNCDGVILPYKKNYLKTIVKRWLLSKAVAYMASGEHAKEYFLRYGAQEDKIFIHHFSTLHQGDLLQTPIENQEKNRLRGKLSLPMDKKIAIAVGRFIPLKRYDYLLNAWKKIDDECCLLLIGGGPELEKYQAIIRETGLKNVIIEGFHPPQELYEYYKAADAFIHPSSYDVWGLVVNEAMANGLPVVVSNHCIAGLELVEEGKNGYLFPMGEEEVAIEKLSLILRDEKTRRNMSLEGIQIIQEYTIENMAKTHMEIFKKVLNEYGK